MLIQIIENNAEEKCISALEEACVSYGNRNLLQCRFSSIGLNPTADDILPIVKDVLADRSASLFFCKDGDLFIAWAGYPKATLEESMDAIRSKYDKNIPEHLSNSFFQYYDFHVHGEDVRLECRKKIIQEQKNKEKEKDGESENKNLCFDNQMLKTLQNSLIDRRNRSGIKILIVEDQLFSRKLLVAALGRKYQCHVAKNASDALILYALHAPDIVFLDIELPDIDGHTFAGLIGKADPDNYIVMVTGNHYAADIEKAKSNKVKGFIVKPYNKQKITDTINQFCHARNKGA